MAICGSARTRLAGETGDASATGANVSIPGLNDDLLLSGNNNSNQDNDHSDNSGRTTPSTRPSRCNLTSQDLSSNVSGVSFNGDDAITDNRSISSGALRYSGGACQDRAAFRAASCGWRVASAADTSSGEAALAAPPRPATMATAEAAAQS